MQVNACYLLTACNAKRMGRDLSCIFFEFILTFLDHYCKYNVWLLQRGLDRTSENVRGGFKQSCNGR